MLRSAPSLWAKTEKGRRAQKLAKRVAGVMLRLAWAGSPTELASQPAHTVVLDELDRMEAIAGEGDPVTLAEARQATYPDGRLIITSTPIEGNVDVERHPVTGIDHWKVAEPADVLSPIWKLWQEGTRFEWAVPCPHCKGYFVPRFRQLWWPEKATAREAQRDARLVCQRCGTHIEDSDKAEMNARGFYLAPGQDVVDGKVVGDIPESDTASFWASGIMSPWRSFGKMAAKWVRARRSGDQERIRAVINTDFGELYAFRGEAQPTTVVRACAGTYTHGEIPAAIKALTCGVDVQKKRLVYVVRGWGYSMESWLVDYGEMWGETDQTQVWEQLSALLERRWGETDDKQGLVIKRMGIDSGYRPGDKWRRPDNLIYDFCLRHRRAVPTKGRDRLNKPLQPSLIDVTHRGQTYKKGLQLWHLDSDYFKSWVHSRLVWPEDQPGRFWVPQDVSEDYCLQMTSETRVAKPSGLATWVKVRNENHFLDCEAINVAVAQSLGFHRKSRKRAEPATTERAPQETDQGAQAAPVPRALPPKPRRQFSAGRPMKNWTTGW
jgi:phage terminase large subunit GpA-like protein